MNYLTSVFLGVLQGATEFLPVSSSGHLALVQSLIPGFNQPGVLFDVILHFGTLFAVLWFFRRELFRLPLKYIGYLVIGTIPSVILGFLLKDKIGLIFQSTKLIGVALIVTGILNLLTGKTKLGKKLLNTKKSFFVGLAQAIAIIPGISRSGATIFAGTAQGLKAEEVVRFSFLLSVPAILGANLLEIIGNPQVGSVPMGIYFVGFLAAMLAGIIAIRLVLRLLIGKKFKFFAYYCFAAGALALFI